MGDQHVGQHDMGYGLLGRFTGNADSNPNTNPYSDINAHADTYSYSNFNPNGHSHSNTYPHSYAHTHAYTNFNPNLYLYPDSHKQGFPCRRRYRRCNGKGLNKHLPMDGNERRWLDHRNVW